jgi:hypothetical protein
VGGGVMPETFLTSIPESVCQARAAAVADGSAVSSSDANPVRRRAANDASTADTTVMAESAGWPSRQPGERSGSNSARFVIGAPRFFTNDFSPGDPARAISRAYEGVAVTAASARAGGVRS